MNPSIPPVTLKSLKAFLAGPNPTEAYVYDTQNPNECLFGQWLLSIGTTLEIQQAAKGAQFNLWLGEIASPTPHTYGAAHARAVAYRD
jgi:hypothetical protein